MKALQIDEHLAEAHAALAFTIHNLEWDWAGAEQHYRRAKELSSDTVHGYGLYLSAAGRHEEAISEIKRAEELDPLTLPVRVNGGLIYSYARKYDLALQQFTQILKENPTYFWAEDGLGSTYIFKNMCSEALASFNRLTKSPTNDSGQLWLAWPYASCGRKAEAIKIMNDLRDLDTKDKITLATIYTALGDKDKAFFFLDKACDERNFYCVFLKVLPQFDSLHSDPRFSALMKRLRIPQ